MKYLVALFLGTSLLASGQAFADDYVYRGDLDDFVASPDVCVDAAKNGVELYTEVEEGKRRITRWYFHEERIYAVNFGVFLEDDDSYKGLAAVVSCLFLKQDEVIARR